MTPTSTLAAAHRPRTQQIQASCPRCISSRCCTVRHLPLCSVHHPAFPAFRCARNFCRLQHLFLLNHCNATLQMTTRTMMQPSPSQPLQRYSADDNQNYDAAQPFYEELLSLRAAAHGPRAAETLAATSLLAQNEVAIAKVSLRHGHRQSFFPLCCRICERKGRSALKCGERERRPRQREESGESLFSRLLWTPLMPVDSATVAATVRQRGRGCVIRRW